MNRHFRSLRLLFFPISLTIASLASLFALQELGPVVGIKSGYVLIGLLFALIIYYTATTNETETRIAREPQSNSILLPKLTLILACLLIAAVGAANFLPGFDSSTVRTVAIVVGLPIGYLLLGIQLYLGVSIKRSLIQIIALFAVDPLTKYMSTYFYFGRGDIPKHVYYIDLVIKSGTWKTIPHSSFYRSFPGLQTLAGSVALLSDLPAYDSLLITGIVTYAIVICTSYLLARLLFPRRLLPLCIALSVTTLSPIHRYSVYFYPQAFAVALVLILILVSIRYSDVGTVVSIADKNSEEDRLVSARYFQALLLTPPMIIALWFTHHLTVVLFIPIVLGLILVPFVAERLFEIRDTVRPLVLPLAVWIIGSATFWLVQDVFIRSLIKSFVNVLSRGEVASSSGAGATIKLLGRQIPEPSVVDAVLSLASPGGIYNILLVSTLAFGVRSILRHPTDYRRAAGFVTVGLLGAIFMVRIPLDIHGLTRTQLPLSVFVAFIIGAGLYRLVSARSLPYKRVIPGLLVFVLLATAGPAVVADDLYSLHSGPNLWETRTLPEPQKDFNAAEMESFQLSSAYIERNGVTVGTDWPSGIGMTRYGADSESFVVEDDRIQTDQDLLLYRQRWTVHSVRLIPEQAALVTVLASEEWMDELVWSENKVYTTGEVGMLADRPSATKFERR